MAGLRALNAEELERCCGARAWVAAMLAAQPCADRAALEAAAEKAFAALKAEDWLEAFRHHPKIGDKAALRAKFASTREWASGEQAGAAAADEATLDALAKGNADYEARFGHIFIVCATGKSAAEMLALLKARIGNDPKEELCIAAGEQVKITKLRLAKLLS
jgi:2-oxo-4-hydroxy-4-carboxy-5-ureidoimidazoline decarboxylase